MRRETLTVDETAEVLGLSRNSVYRAIRNGTIPALRIGRRYLVCRTTVAEMLRVGVSDSRTASTSDAAFGANPTAQEAEG